MSLPLEFRWDDDVHLGPETARLTRLLWPGFLIEESDIPDDSLAFEMDPKELAYRLPNWGIRRTSDNSLVAHLSAALISADISADISTDKLPDTGWYFAMQAVARGEKPNCVCLLAANVDPQVGSLGLAKALLERAKDTTQKRGFRALIAPVRPSAKREFPDVPMSEYVKKKTPEGQIYDPWLRAHVKAGAEVLNVCRQSVTIQASVSRWEKWTGMKFHCSGEYLIPDALVPLQIDLASKLGVYREPGIWVRYRL